MSLPSDIERSVTALHGIAPRLVLFFAGAGSLGLSWLHAVGGSSRTVVEAVDTYARESLLDWLGASPGSLASPATAAAMARAARARAVRLGIDALGVGLTGAIATDRTRRGADRVWIGVDDGSRVHLRGATLVKERRDRAGEEAVAGRLLIAAICAACGLPEPATGLEDDEPLEQPDEPVEGGALAVLGGSVPFWSRDEVPRALLPGSFDPVHRGHRAMAAAAAAQLGTPVGFELAVTNVDKAGVDAAEVARRAEAFTDGESLVISATPRFVEKSELFPGRTFVVGWDTAVRVLDPVYYPDGLGPALERIAGAGCSFLVAGREVDGTYHDGGELSVPADCPVTFDVLPASSFRVDISSTALRRANEADHDA